MERTSTLSVTLVLMLLAGSIIGLPAPAQAQEMNDPRDEEVRGSPLNAPLGMSPIMPEKIVQLDTDRNGLGDKWEKPYAENLSKRLEPFQDLDADCLLNAGEFAWHTIPVGPLLLLFPNARDFDSDNFTDAEEVAYWNNASNDHTAYYAVGGDCPVGAPVPRPGDTPPAAVTDPDALQNFDDDFLFTTQDPDSDNDTLLDGDEVKGNTHWGFASDPSRRDSDGDGLNDSAETGEEGWGANPQARDSDADLLDDAAELKAWRDIHQDPRNDTDRDGLPGLLDPDSDGDALDDGKEQFHRTNFTDRDTDDDNMTDGWEVRYMLDPLDPEDADDDPDGDGLINRREHDAGSSPRERDSDRDTLEDGFEAQAGTDPAKWDSDDDGMPDGWEALHEFDPLDPADADADPDGDSFTDPSTGSTLNWTNRDEYEYLRPTLHDESRDGTWWNGTDPTRSDTDGDATPDGEEVARGDFAAPPVAGVDPDDIDGDGLGNMREVGMGLHPSRADSDGDGLCDGGRAPACRAPGLEAGAPGETIGFGSNPYPPNTDTDLDGLDDWSEASLVDPDVDGDGLPAILDADTDGDGLDDGYEKSIGTDHTKADTDGDGLSDREEDARRTKPTDADTDGDGLGDGEEVSAGTDPLRTDPDRDGATDAQELLAITDPWNDDTDDDGMLDGWELRHRLDPHRAQDAPLDGDGDDLPNLEEQRWRSDPWDADTDADTIPDGLEVTLGLHPAHHELHRITVDDGDGLDGIVESALGTDPWTYDTDEDGLSDGAEALGPRVVLPDPFAALGLPRLVRTSLDTLALLSDPTVSDTDADGIDDARELALWQEVGADAVTTDYRPQRSPAPPISVRSPAAPDADVPEPPAFTSNLREPDADGDGLDDGDEWLTLGTDAHRADTDGDSYTDFDEVWRGSNPRDPQSVPTDGERLDPTTDTDRDGLTDVVERGRTFTNPEDADSDDDGLDDGNELNAWLTYADTDDVELVRARLQMTDYDQDGVPDGEEFAFAVLSRAAFFTTDPADPDSDRDGLLDGQEGRNSATVLSVRAHEQELQRDLRGWHAGAGDAVADGSGSHPATTSDQGTHAGFVKGAWGTLILPYAAGTPDAGSRSPDGCSVTGEGAPDARDSDGDGLTDGHEEPADAPPVSGTCSRDFDRDGIQDPYEVRHTPQGDVDGDGRPPARDGDSDGDSLGDGSEDRNRNGFPDDDALSSLDQDTDDDGLRDDAELALRLNPSHPDSDSDGLPDGLEYGVKSAPDETEGASPWTDLSAQMTCGGRPVGPTFQRYQGSGAHLTDAASPDSDRDDLLDGFEDYNKNGMFGPTTYRSSEDPALIGEWPELNPRERDSDGDGRSDGQEITGIFDIFRGLRGNGPSDGFRGYCETLDKLHANAWTLEQILSNPTFFGTATNPHHADTDGDGVVDATDVDPRSATSLLKITGFTYQQLEQADPGCTLNDTEDSCHPYAPELSLRLDMTIGGKTLPLKFPSLDGFNAPAPRSLLEVTPEAVETALTDYTFSAASGSWAFRLPQYASFYRQAAADPTSAQIILSAHDRDAMKDDLIDLSTTSDTSFIGSLPLAKFGASHHVLVAEGNSPSSWGVEDPKNGRIVIRFQPPFQEYFLREAVAHLGG